MLDELLVEYADKFDNNFPIFQVKHLEENEIIKLIETSLETNKPYDPEDQDDVDY